MALESENNETPTTTKAEPTNSSTEPTSEPTTVDLEDTKAEEPTSNEPTTTLSKAAAEERTPTEEPAAGEEPTTEEPATETPAEDEGYELELEDDSPLSQEDLDAIATEAAEKGYTKEQADAIVKQQESLVSKGIKVQLDAHNALIAANTAELNADINFVGDKREESFASIKRATDAFGSPELNKVLNDPLTGNSLALAKFLKSIGDAMGDDNIEGKGAIPKPPAENPETSKMKTMYPNFFK